MRRFLFLPILMLLALLALATALGPPGVAQAFSAAATNYDCCLMAPPASMTTAGLLASSEPAAIAPSADVNTYAIPVALATLAGPDIAANRQEVAPLSARSSSRLGTLVYFPPWPLTCQALGTCRPAMIQA